jgi:hypothetical protein
MFSRCSSCITDLFLHVEQLLQPVRGRTSGLYSCGLRVHHIGVELELTAGGDVLQRALNHAFRPEQPS